MKLITRDTDYAMRALMYLATSGKTVVSSVELVKNVKLPRPFARKIMHELEKNNIVKSAQGAHGGFWLAKPVREIYLAELIAIFQGDTDVGDCLFKKKMCPNVRTCPLRKKIDSIGQMVNKEFKGVTIGSLMKDQMRPKLTERK